MKIDIDAASAGFSRRFDRAKLRFVCRREGHYLLRTNFIDDDPAKRWEVCPQLVSVAGAFKTLKGDLAI